MRRVHHVAAVLLSVGGVLGAGCQGTQQQLTQARSEATRLEHENNILRGRLQGVTDQLMGARAQLEQHDANPAEDARAELERKLRQMGIKVSANADGALVVRLVNSILFDTGKADLKDSAKRALDRVADELKANFAGHPVRVEGHTDNVPIRHGRNYKDNWELSAARGTSVLRYLTEKGVPPHQIYVGAFGMYRPVKPNDSKSGRAANRRVDIVILPKINVERQSIALK
jgi:chemotaxis protein MotB